jgi:6-phosphogluconolactonase
MVYDALIAHLSIPQDNVHRIRAEQVPVKAAVDYENEARRFFQQRKGRHSDGELFDLALLGLGEDGHTASLFPGSPALLEKERWFVMVEHDQPPEPLVDRVTATLPLINASHQVTFLVSGEKKADRVRQALVAEKNRAMPVQLVQPVSGNLLWLLDRPAALKLPPGYR